MLQRQKDLESGGLYQPIGEVAAEVDHVRGLDFVAELVVDLALEAQNLLREGHLEDLRLGFVLENTLEALHVLHFAVDQQLAFGELVVLIALDLFLDRKRHTIRVRCLENDQKESLCPEKTKTSSRDKASQR